MKNFAGMNGRKSFLSWHIVLSSVVIDNLDVLRIRLNPPEANPPPIVNANAVLALSVSLQRLQLVSPHGGNFQKAARRIEADQPSSPGVRNALKPADRLAMKKPLSIGGQRNDVITVSIIPDVLRKA